MNTQKILNKAVYAVILVALAAPAALKAQAAKPARFGAGASVINPMGEFGDVGAIGIGGSFFMEWELNDQMGIRGRAEYNIFGQKDWGTYGTMTTSGMIAMADFVYRFDSHDTGWYVFGGAGFVNRSYALDYRGLKETTGKMGPGIAVGGGYNFTPNFGVDGCYNETLGDISANYAYPSFTWLQVSARWRF